MIGGKVLDASAPLLGAAGVFDALAGNVLRVAGQRGWPALTADPGRVHRVAPDLEVDLL